MIVDFTQRLVDSVTALPLRRIYGFVCFVDSRLRYDPLHALFVGLVTLVAVTRSQLLILVADCCSWFSVSPPFYAVVTPRLFQFTPDSFAFGLIVAFYFILPLIYDSDFATLFALFG